MTLLPRLTFLIGAGLIVTGLIGSGLTALIAAHAASDTNAIAQALRGNTLNGSLDASGPFEEYYDSSGAIHGADYTGTWTLQGDSLCLGYDGNPPSCWTLELDGDSLVWRGKSGAVEGHARIIKGNPKGF